MSLSASKSENHPPLIELTDAARDKIRALMGREVRPEGTFLRVSVVGGGCSGYSYKMNFENQLKDGDRSFESNGITLALDAKSALFITGLKIHYEDGLNGAGFVYENPKAAKSCGCGTSFSV